MKPIQLGFEFSRTLLSAYDIPILGRMVLTRDQAIIAAKEFGFPVAIKTVSSQVIHKSDLGCVLLGLTDQTAVQAGYDQLMVRRKALNNQSICKAKEQIVFALSGLIIMDHLRSPGNRHKACS